MYYIIQYIQLYEIKFIFTNYENNYKYIITNYIKIIVYIISLFVKQNSNLIIC